MLKKTARKLVRKVPRVVALKKSVSKRKSVSRLEIPAPPEVAAVLLPEIDIVESVSIVEAPANVMHERTVFIQDMPSKEEAKLVLASNSFSNTLTEWFSSGIPVKSTETEVEEVNLAEKLPEKAVEQLIEAPVAALCTSYYSAHAPSSVEINLLTDDLVPVTAVSFHPTRQVLWHAVTFAVLALFFVTPFQLFFSFPSQSWGNQFQIFYQGNRSQNRNHRQLLDPLPF